MTELATIQTGSTLTLESDQTFWTEHQVAGLRQLGVDRAGNGDLAVYLHVCQRTGLDPFARQIYMIERQGKQTIQTGIDGFRLVARRAVDRTGETLSIGASEWCDQDGTWTDVWLKDYPPSAARVVAYRNGEAFPGTALWREYAQTKRDGDLTAMWRDRPAGQLAKCAEALALRKAFPHDLSGVYTDDELANDRRAQRAERRGGLTAALAGDPTVSTPDESPGAPAGVVETPPPSGVESDPITKRTRGQLFALFAQKGVEETDQLPGINHITSKTYTSRADVTEADALDVIEVLKARPDVDAPMDVEVVS